MKQILILLSIIFAINCSTITKEQLDKLINLSNLKAPSNFTSLYTSLNIQSIKYAYGVLEENSISTALDLLTPKTTQEKDLIVNFLQEAEYSTSGNMSPINIQINDKTTTMNGMFGLLTSQNEEKPLYIIIKYENVTYEAIKYKYTRVKVCKKKFFVRRCHYKNIKVPYTLTGYDHTAIQSGIFKKIYEKVYQDILKTIKP